MIEQVVTPIRVFDIAVIRFVPVGSPVFRDRVKYHEPVAAVLEARIPANYQEGQTVNAKPVSPAVMNAVIGVGNQISVVAAAPPPIAVLGLPVGGAMLLPRTVLFFLPLTLPLWRTLELGGSLSIGLLAASLRLLASLLLDPRRLGPSIARRPLLTALWLLDALLLRPGIVRWPHPTALLLFAALLLLSLGLLLLLFVFVLRLGVLRLRLPCVADCRNDQEHK